MSKGAAIVPRFCAPEGVLLLVHDEGGRSSILVRSWVTHLPGIL